MLQQQKGTPQRIEASPEARSLPLFQMIQHILAGDEIEAVAA